MLNLSKCHIIRPFGPKKSQKTSLVSMAVPHGPDMPGDPSLAALWEMEPSIRVASRESSCLTKWASTRVIGVASTGAMSLNIKVLELLAEWWAKKVDMPQAIPIDKLRAEVGQQKWNSISISILVKTYSILYSNGYSVEVC